MNTFCKISFDYTNDRVDGMIVPACVDALDFAMEHYMDGAHRIILDVDGLNWEWHNEFSETAMDQRREMMQE